MADAPVRNRFQYQLSVAALVAALAGGLILLGCGIYLAAQPDAAGQATLVIAAALLLMVGGGLAYGIFGVLLKAEGNINRLHQLSLDIHDVLRRMEPLLKTTAENSQISDAVRAITHRETERDALRQAIREEMYRGEWEAAHYLINEIERRFGYRQEAETLRKELAGLREMTIEEKINEAVAHIEKLMTDYRWERARVEIDRLLRLFSRHERVAALPETWNRRREERKQELLNLWKQALERSAIDEGIAILAELDPYLSREEAQALQDSARDVFKARLLNLGVRFSLAVSENRWRDALETGVLIVQEFPNSRMAQEVNQRMEALRLRAGFKADAEVIQQKRPAAG